jgi:hypothetical protein
MNQKEGHQNEKKQVERSSNNKSVERGGVGSSGGGFMPQIQDS